MTFEQSKGKPRWKKTVNQRGNEWWQIGKNKENSNHLPKQWIHLGKTTPYHAKEFGNEYEVRASDKINEETIYGHSRFYKKKSSAKKFVDKYMKSH